MVEEARSLSHKAACNKLQQSPTKKQLRLLCHMFCHFPTQCRVDVTSRSVMSVTSFQPATHGFWWAAVTAAIATAAAAAAAAAAIAAAG
jgi:hypothetical protein